MMRSDDFEDRLARVPRAGPPKEWRADILRVAVAERSAAPLESRSSPRRQGESWFGWRLAWSGLAVAWVAVFGLKFAAEGILRPTQSVEGERSWVGRAAPARATAAAWAIWREQRRLCAQLLAEGSPVPTVVVERTVRPNSPPRPGPRGDLRRSGFGRTEDENPASALIA